MLTFTNRLNLLHDQRIQELEAEHKAARKKDARMIKVKRLRLRKKVKFSS